MDLKTLTVAVVGGGIGGLAAACLLASRGAQVDVFEQAAAFGEVGAGLQISANGQAVLRALGVVEGQAPEHATVSPGTEFRDGARGRFVARIPAPKAGPTWYMHRADLLALLVDKAQSLGVTMTFGRVVAPGMADADLVIAADGVKSAWRSMVDGPDQPSFTGQVAWRAVVPWDTYDGDGAAVLSMGHRAHVVTYPLRSGTLMNLVAVEERADWTEEGWSLAGDVSDLRARFASFGGEVGAIIRAAPKVHQWALHARPVASRWVKDRVALLGDAAHPTLPFMAQGACLALEDASVLTAALVGNAKVEEALAAYQNARRDRAQSVVDLARGNAWRFHMGKPFAWGAQAVLAVGAGALARRLEWVYGYDPNAALDEAVVTLRR